MSIPKTPIDLEEIRKQRKKRQRNYRIRQLAVLFLIGFGILVALYINDAVVRRDIPSQLGGIVESAGGDGFPTILPSGKVKDLESVDKNLVVLKESNLYVYNNKGKQIKNIQQMTERSVVDTSADRILVYKIGGRELAVHSTTNELFTLELENNIIHADVGHSGHIAVVSSPANFVAEIAFYTAKGDKTYSLSFSETLISSVEVSPKGKQLAATSVGSDGGVLDYKLLIYQVNTKNEPTEINLGNRLVVDVNFYQEDTISVLTDKDFLVYDTATGQLIGSYSFIEQMELIEFRRANNDYLVLLKDKDTREYTLILINTAGTELSSLRLEQRPIDYSFGNKTIFILKGDTIEQYNYALDMLEIFSAGGVERIYALDGNLYLIGETEIDVLDLSGKEEK